MLLPYKNPVKRLLSLIAEGSKVTVGVTGTTDFRGAYVAHSGAGSTDISDYYTKAELNATGANAGSTLIGTNTTNFDNNLTVADNTVQKALDTLDDLSVLVNPMTAAGDLIVGGVAGAPARYGIGAAGDFLGVAGGTPAWEDPEARFYTETELDGGQLDNRYYTEAELDAEFLLYAKLAGRAGDQTLYGGINANDTLHLNSTSNANKGIVGIEKLIGRNVWMLDIDHDAGTVSIHNIADGNSHISLGAAAGVPTIFNEDGIDTDFQIKGNTVADLFNLDAGLDMIGIGVAVPNEKLTIKDFLSLGEVSVIGAAATAGFGKFFYASDDNRFKGLDDTGNVHQLDIEDGEVWHGQDLAEDPEGGLRWFSDSPGYVGQSAAATVTAAPTYAFTFGANYGCTDAHGLWSWVARRDGEAYEQSEVSIGVPCKAWANGGGATIRARIKVNDVSYLDAFYLWWNNVSNVNALVTRGRTDVLASMVNDTWYEASWNVTLPTVGANGSLRIGVWPVGRDIPANGPVMEIVQVSVEWIGLRIWAV